MCVSNKSDSVKKIFSETIARLEETKTLGNESMPSSFVLRGRAQEHPVLS